MLDHLFPDALVQAPNGLDAKQKHCRFRNGLLAAEPVDIFRRNGASCIGTIDTCENSNRLICHIESVDDPPNQIRPVPLKCCLDRQDDAYRFPCWSSACLLYRILAGRRSSTPARERATEPGSLTMARQRGRGVCRRPTFCDEC